MKRETRRVLELAASGFAPRVDSWDARDALESDQRQRAELRRLRAFVRACATYECACGDGEICVGCAARQTLRRKL